LEGLRRVALSVTAADALGQDKPPEEISEVQRHELLVGMVQNILIQIVGASEGIEVSEEDIDLRVQQGIDSLGDTGTYEEFLTYYGYTEETLRADLTQQTLRNKLLELLAKDCDIAEAEIVSRFDTLTEAGELNAVDTADFLHIVVFVKGTNAAEWKVAEEKIIAARSRIEAGEVFQLVAAEVSEEQTVRATDGLSRNITKKQIPEALQATVFESELGELSDPIGTEYGWHLIKPVDRRDASPLTLEQAREAILAQLVQQCQSEALRARLDAARVAHPVSLRYRLTVPAK
jgi:foldase protein PrsA